MLYVILCILLCTEAIVSVAIFIWLTHSLQFQVEMLYSNKKSIIVLKYMGVSILWFLTIPIVIAQAIIEKIK